MIEEELEDVIFDNTELAIEVSYWPLGNSNNAVTISVIKDEIAVENDAGTYEDDFTQKFVGYIDRILVPYSTINEANTATSVAKIHEEDVFVIDGDERTIINFYKTGVGYYEIHLADSNTYGEGFYE